MDGVRIPFIQWFGTLDIQPCGVVDKVLLERRVAEGAQEDGGTPAVGNDVDFRFVYHVQDSTQSVHSGHLTETGGVVPDARRTNGSGQSFFRTDQSIPMEPDDRILFFELDFLLYELESSIGLFLVVIEPVN